MNLKTIMLTAILAGFAFLYNPFEKHEPAAETPIDNAWWNSLSAEWREILFINQQFQQQGLDIAKLQKEYFNRINIKGAEEYSAMNTYTSLYKLREGERFSLGYHDLYVRAIRNKQLIPADSIDLGSLANLTTIYMVNGPSDLTPIKKFPRLKVLIINYCGINNSGTSGKAFNLEPLLYLKELSVFQCYATPVQSLAALNYLPGLQELDIDNCGVSDLGFVKNPASIKKLSIGPGIARPTIISGMFNLEELYINGCRKLPRFTTLKKLKRLSISENEMAIVNGSYRICNLHFLEGLSSLEYLDLAHTSYRGSLEVLYHLPNLKAVTLPAVDADAAGAFKKHCPQCIIINAYQFER